jgi:hypothetical protein
MKGFVLLLVLIISGCDIPEQPIVDQCLRVELFQNCLKIIPAGPTTVVSNDWAEVVDECETTAYYQSKRLREFIKPECRSTGD